jgi:hypothetical protein
MGILFLCVGFTLADEIRVIITKVDGDKVMYVDSRGKGGKVPEKTLPVAKDVKVVKGKYNKDTKTTEVGEPLEGGLKHKMFTEIGETGVRATLVTDKDNKTITEIRVLTAGRRGKQ